MGKNSTELIKAGFSAATSTALGTLGSCVQYNLDGSISWDQEKFHDNKTWSQAGLSFTTSFGTQALSIGLRAGVDIGNKTYSLNSNLFHTAISSTLGTLSANIKVENDGGWDWQGFGNIDGQKAVVEGVGSYASAVMTGGMRDQYFAAFMGSMIGAYVKKGVSELFEHYGGRDFDDEYSLSKPIKVDTLSISTRQAMDALKDYFAPDDRKKMKVIEKKPKIDGFTGAFSDLGTIGAAFSNEWQTIKNDVATLGTSLVGLGSLALEGIEAIGDGIASLWNGVKGLFRSSGLSDNERKTMLAESRKAWENGTIEKWIVRNNYKGKDFNNFVDAMGLDPRLKDIAKDLNMIDDYQENRKKNYVKDKDGILAPKDHRQYADYFDAKLRLSKELGSEFSISLQDKADLVRTVQQKEGASLARELVETIKGNTSYKKMLQDKGITLKSDADIVKYANDVAHDACVNANLWVSLKVAGANVESYYGDFYMKNVERNELVAGQKDPTIINARRDSWGIDYQRITKFYKIDGKDIEVVRGSDYNAFYNDIKNHDVVVRGTWGHNMSIFDGKLYDTGLAGRKWGGVPTKYIEEDKLSSYYYLKAK